MAAMTPQKALTLRLTLHRLSLLLRTQAVEAKRAALREMVAAEERKAGGVK